MFHYCKLCDLCLLVEHKYSVLRREFKHYKCHLCSEYQLIIRQDDSLYYGLAPNKYEYITVKNMYVRFCDNEISIYCGSFINPSAAKIYTINKNIILDKKIANEWINKLQNLVLFQ